MVDFTRQLLNCRKIFRQEGLARRLVRASGPRILLAAWGTVLLGNVPRAVAEPAEHSALDGGNRPSAPIVLGADELFRGIPGEGPLTNEQIERWLDDPRSHDPLEPRLPWHLAEAQDQVAVPPDNPLTRAKIELGRQLFFDKRIGVFSCGGCHLPAQSYSAGQVFPDTGLNPLVTFNRILGKEHFWDGKADSLEHQPLTPVSNPFEMAVSPEEITAAIFVREGYRRQCERIFGEVSFNAYCRALASFQRALVAGPSIFDYLLARERLGGRGEDAWNPSERAIWDDAQRILAANPPSPSAQRGRALFFSEQARCAECHPGPNFTDEAYHDLGIRDKPESTNLGRFKVTWREEDRGAFKTPTLRNVSRTPPYMHNGQFFSLEEAVRFFSDGRGVSDRAASELQPIHLSANDCRDLVEFLKLLDSPLPNVRTDRLPE